MKALARIGTEPASYIMTAAGVVAALVLAFAHLTPGNAAIASGAITAVATAITAILARPVNYAVIAGAAGIVVQSLVLVGVHWSPGQQAAVVAAVNVITGFLAMRQGLTPTVTLRAEHPAMHAVQP